MTQRSRRQKFGERRIGEDRRDLDRRGKERRSGERRIEICPTCRRILNALNYCYHCKKKVIQIA